MDWLLAQTAINVFLQHLGTWLLLPMQFFSYLGTEEFFMIFLPLIFWSVDIMLGIRVGLILLFSNGINHTLKILFHSPRPFWINPEVKGLALETSFGLPSNHAQISAGLWGMGAVYFRKKWALITSIILIFMIGLSRLYLGVHFLTDVLLGWTLGGLILWLYLKCEPRLIQWLKSISFQNRIIWSIISTFIILFMMYASSWVKAVFQLPEIWQVNASPYLAPGMLLDPFNTEGAFTIAGTWLGMTLGIAWMFSRRNGYDLRGSYTQKVARYLLGVAGVLIIRFGLKMIFPEGDNLLGDVFRMTRYTMIGLWVSIFAPLIFIRVGLTPAAKK